MEAVGLTTILYAALVAFGLLAADAVVYSGSVVVELSAPPKTDTLDVDKEAVKAEFDNLLVDVTKTQSVVSPPELVWSSEQGVGQALANRLDLENVALALKSQFGVAPDRLRVSFYVDQGVLRALVSGNSHFGQQFEEVLTRDKGEAVLTFVRRCALSAVSEIAPYSTAIHLLETHAADMDFTEVVSLVQWNEGLLPPTPTSFDRSLFDNLLGLVALFKNDPKGAEVEFAKAMQAYPANPVPFINAAFADLQLNDYPQAASRMEQLIRVAPPENKVLLASAYMTWGAALMGLHELDGADRLFATATEINPVGSTAYGLWAEERRLQGDEKTAAELDRRALENTASLENYAEVAALYFHLAWEDNRPVTLSKFSNPAVVTFH